MHLCVLTFPHPCLSFWQTEECVYMVCQKSQNNTHERTLGLLFEGFLKTVSCKDFSFISTWSKTGPMTSLRVAQSFVYGLWTCQPSSQIFLPNLFEVYEKQAAIHLSGQLWMMPDSSMTKEPGDKIFKISSHTFSVEDTMNLSKKINKLLMKKNSLKS